MITAETLRAIMPLAGRRASIYAAPLAEAMAEFEINTPARQAAFIAQIAHESGSLVFVREIASGKAYEGRRDLGNLLPGDGVKFRGRGLIQITGRANYSACSRAVCGDPFLLLEHPELLEAPTAAARSAAWYWRQRGLNELADKGEFDKITRKINGGTNGRIERRAFWLAAKRALGVPV